ncbi:MAG TPA: DUF4331 family protein [Pyrinomonadaceae bacterium]|nr:DUF4331 family protein [Pyrinomonadaceae bacterium]
MFCLRLKRPLAFALLAAMTVTSLFLPLAQVKAADHAESTSVAGDPGADIGDVFAFLDPNDNTKVVLALDVEGFVVPSEALNLSFFAPDVTYRFEIENTGDAVPDQQIDVTFSRQTSRSTPQTATIKFKGNRIRPNSFTAPTTVQTFNAVSNPFTVTTDPVTGTKFFAGLTDDPFYFDIVGFNRFVSSVLGGTPDATRLQRGRDSFAGYNIHMIALEVPASLIRGRVNAIGINGVTLRRRSDSRSAPEEEEVPETLRRGDQNGLVQIDRMATPAVNTALIPFPRKNEYNAATPSDDANGQFASDIVGTLTALGTNSANIGILANVAVTNGDYLRLNLLTPNTSLGFGERATTPGYTGFPNGRRPGDDTVDVLLYFITNQAVTQGDNVNSNDVPLGTSFPFFARPNQPLENPAVDNTRN